MKINIEEIQVKIKFIEAENLKAIISLDFGEMTIKGFRVAKSNYKNNFGKEFWLTPPAYRDRTGSYHPIFFIPNKELWKELEEKIWNEYDKQYDEYSKKIFGMEEGDY